MIPREIASDVVGTCCTALLRVLIDVVKHQQPADVVRSCEPVQHVRHYRVKVRLVPQSMTFAPVGKLVVWDPFRMTGDALSQPIF